MCYSRTQKTSCSPVGNPAWFYSYNSDRNIRKREHLLSQIRDQAAEIQRLMEQLEAANRKASVASPSSESASASEMGSIAQLESDVPGTAQNQAEVQDWVAKARESIVAFGGFIGIGSASSARNLIEGSDSDESDSYEEYEPDSDYADELSVRWDEGSYPRVNLDDGGRKKDVFSEKMATVPSHITPFGLMANLSLRRNRSTRAMSAEVDDDEVGVARDDYFRAGKSFVVFQMSVITSLAIHRQRPIQLNVLGTRSYMNIPKS